MEWNRLYNHQLTNRWQAAVNNLTHYKNQWLWADSCRKGALSVEKMPLKSIRGNVCTPVDHLQKAFTFHVMSTL